MKVAQKKVKSFCDLFQSLGVLYKDRRAQSAVMVNDWLAVLSLVRLGLRAFLLFSWTTRLYFTELACRFPSVLEWLRG